MIIYIVSGFANLDNKVIVYDVNDFDVIYEKRNRDNYVVSDTTVVYAEDSSISSRLIDNLQVIFCSFFI